ncbi:hypothetical protein [Leuconostoc citreum]|uniref:hypothetical protein n=1 Tax=Leuconostoc citreum TaxID=33964 RepID=UPI00209D238B|nr:hypothetical protein [Leuconostoc citreum]MCP1275666.1 hypothetical protein [Leuconostoc citreum]
MTQKIDFHIHTLPGNNNKDEFDIFSMDWLKEYVSCADLNAIAITNHNFFDVQNFNEIRKQIPEIEVFPGMELSLNKGHVNIVGDNDLETIESFCKLSQRTELLDNKSSIDTDELLKHMSLDKTLFIFEYDKANSMDVPERIAEHNVVYGVSKQLKFLKFKKQHFDKVPVVFSDAHATDLDSDSSRNDISKLSLKNTFVQADSNSFSDLVAAMRSSDKVSITKDMLSDVYQIGKTNVSSGLNLIVGKRGTGKTVFLNSIKKYYNSEDIAEIKQFETAKTDEFLQQQQERFGNEAFRDWLKQRETTISSIKEWLVNSEQFPKNIATYLDDLRSYADQATIKNIATQNNLFRATAFDFVNSVSIEKALNSLKEIINNTDLWINFLNQTSKNRSYFIETYSELREICINTKRENILKYKVNELLKDVKGILELHTGINPPPEFSFTNLVREKEIEKSINKSMSEFSKKQKITSEDISGYSIEVSLSSFPNASEFQKQVKTNEAVADDVIKPYMKKEYTEYFRHLKQKKFFDINKFEQYLAFKQTRLLTPNHSIASGGQATAFALMLKLEQSRNKHIILVDEPEASLDNAFIKNELIDELTKLKHFSSVFVVTHNSTLGSLLKPDYLIVTKYDASIVAENDDARYRILSGEYSSAKLYDAKHNSYSSYDDFVEAMEAGIDTYKSKGEQYAILGKGK